MKYVAKVALAVVVVLGFSVPAFAVPPSEAIFEVTALRPDGSFSDHGYVVMWNYDPTTGIGDYYQLWDGDPLGLQYSPFELYDDYETLGCTFWTPEFDYPAPWPRHWGYSGYFFSLGIVIGVSWDTVYEEWQLVFGVPL